MASSPPRGRLFHAIVLAGAALGGACSTSRPLPAPDAASAEAGGEAAAGLDARAGDAAALDAGIDHAAAPDAGVDHAPACPCGPGCPPYPCYV
jgi:hypothetical protein